MPDGYYPNTALAEYRLESITELQNKIDDARAHIQDLEIDIESLNCELKIARARYLIDGFKVQIDDWEYEIRELEGN